MYYNNEKIGLIISLYNPKGQIHAGDLTTQKEDLYMKDVVPNKTNQTKIEYSLHTIQSQKQNY